MRSSQDIVAEMNACRRQAEQLVNYYMAFDAAVVQGQSPQEALETALEADRAFTQPSTPSVIEPSPCRDCGRLVFRLRHHGSQTETGFELRPSPEGECMLDFRTGMYRILQPVPGGRRRTSGSFPPLPDEQGPFRYHICATTRRGK